ncbi:uncharacterized protein MJAP1_000317 [Malassezia japonica]|uniref:Signal peptidase complex subunit 1 n=1 Tax=Malassezia japonica TaxID=223818 RepID=A0AAF0F333_9BASI|nr:uncharacterized protein MJAP1_000317 [Malassezia japonica]WFD37373.1 hypothetical protein MJAP1_000317 [Malassezia japonica]
MDALNKYGAIDYQGQLLAEKINQRLLISGAILAFIVGYACDNLALTMYTFGAFFALSLLVCVPPWPMYNRCHVQWLPSTTPAA